MGKPKQISKEDLIQAVKQQLLQQGYNKVTLKNVAEQVGVTQGVVYYHFKTKDQLLLSLLQHYLENTVKEEFQPFSTLEPREGFKAYLKEVAYQTHVKSDEQQLLFEMAVLSLHHRELRKVMGKVMQSRVQEINRYLNEDELNGRIIRALLDGLALQALFDPSFDMKEMLHYVNELFIERG